MSQEKQIKNVLKKKFSKNEYNFDEFCVIMGDYQFLLCKPDGNYTNEMKNIFNKFTLNGDGYATKDDIITSVCDIIIDALNGNNNNSDGEYKLNENNLNNNNGFYMNQMNALRKHVDSLETAKLKHESECNTLKQERIEYENAYNNILNELNDYKAKYEEMDDIKMSMTMISQTTQILSEDNIELTNNYDVLNSAHKILQNNYKSTLDELKELKILNNELKLLNDNYVKVNANIKQRNIKTETELNKLRNILNDMENKIYKPPITLQKNDSNGSSNFGDIPASSELSVQSNNPIYDMKLQLINDNKASKPDRKGPWRSTVFRIKSKRLSLVSQSGTINDLQSQLVFNDTESLNDEQFFDDDIFEQELRAQIEDELKLQYKVRFDQMRIQHKMKINEAKNYYDNKLKVRTQQAKEALLSMQKDMKQLKKKLKKQKIIQNELQQQNQNKNNSRYCNIIWKGNKLLY